MEDQSHIERARRAYKAFRLLSRQQLQEDAFSRGYYAILHLSFALLLRSDLSLPKTHSGLVSRMWEGRKTLRIEDDLIQQISRFQALRESGDYAAVPGVTAADLQKIDAVIIRLFKRLEVAS